MIHQLVIYQRPAQGTAAIANYPVQEYRHRIAAVGWYDTASCTIAVPGRDAAEAFLERYLGCRVGVFADDPIVPCWEGYINRITAGNYTVSLQDMLNRVDVQYSIPAATTKYLTGAANDASSQAVYGIREGKLELGVIASGSTNTQATNLRDTILAIKAWPQRSIIQSEPGVIRLEMEGFYHTLEWETYEVASTLAEGYSTWLTGTLLPAVANGDTFFDNTDTTGITTNAATRRRGEYGGRSIWEQLVKMTEAGDGASAWVIGIEPTGITGTRRMYYRQSNTEFLYTTRLNTGGRILNLFNKPVAPWWVRPDRGIMVMDNLLPWIGVGDNPYESYITQVEYDARSGEVRWQGYDNVDAEGVFQVKTASKPTGRRFGASPRTVI